MEGDILIFKYQYILEIPPNAKREVKEGQRVFGTKKEVLMYFIYGHNYIALVKLKA